GHTVGAPGGWVREKAGVARRATTVADILVLRRESGRKLTDDCARGIPQSEVLPVGIKFEVRMQCRVCPIFARGKNHQKRSRPQRGGRENPDIGAVLKLISAQGYRLTLRVV